MSLSLYEMSQCIDNREYEKVECVINDFITLHSTGENYLNIKKEHIGQTFLSKQEQMNYTFCDSFANIIIRLFCAPGYKPSKQTIVIFLGGKHAVEMLFSSSIWKNTDSVIDHLKLIQPDKNGQTKLTEHQLTVLLMLITLGSKYRLPWKAFFAMSPENALTAYMGLITQRVSSLTKETSKGFNFLLESAKDLPFFDLPVAHDLTKLAYSFFNCSYATSPDKYEFKKWMTTLIRLNLNQWLDDEVKAYIADLPAFQFKKKPKVAVMLERYSSNHAMYRCYNEFLTDLSKNYELVAFIDAGEIESSDLSVFDRVIGFDSEVNINDNVKLIINENPDIVFYPSVGMKFWGLYLSQMRLAPIQAMMGGHPSSSFSPEMDYFFMIGHTHTAADIQPYFIEKVIFPSLIDNSVSPHTRQSDLTDSFISDHNHFLNDDDEIIIGINGVLTKVTFDIVDLCKRIQQGTSKKLTFIFFSQHSSNQLAYLSAKKQLSRELKHFELVCFSDYLAYIKTTSRCHFLLPTLPFGGTNSNIDAMVLNKPKLFIKGDSYLYTRCDHEEWARLGLVDELGCSSTEELIDKSLVLVEDNTYRKNLYNKMTANCTLDRIFKSDNQENTVLTQLFSNMISDHKKTQKV
jgi:hypothetical protein